jgi:hypothetical protein
MLHHSAASEGSVEPDAQGPDAEEFSDRDVERQWRKRTDTRFSRGVLPECNVLFTGNFSSFQK